jgi:hypothetical protein
VTAAIVLVHRVNFQHKRGVLPFGVRGLGFEF